MQEAGATRPNPCPQGIIAWHGRQMVGVMTAVTRPPSRSWWEYKENPYLRLSQVREVSKDLGRRSEHL